MNSILTLLGIGIGFVNGFVWSKLIKLQEINNLQEQLYANTCLKDDYLDLIEKLESQNKRLRQIIASDEEKFEAVRLTLTKPNCLPPPNSPLSRSEPLLRNTGESNVLDSTD